jgi:hypothetical protein
MPSANQKSAQDKRFLHHLRLFGALRLPTGTIDFSSYRAAISLKNNSSYAERRRLGSTLGGVCDVYHKLPTLPAEIDTIIAAALEPSDILRLHLVSQAINQRTLQHFGRIFFALVRTSLIHQSLQICRKFRRKTI